MTVAIIPAAGISSRLHPLTLNYPKCLLPVGGGKTLIEKQIEILKRSKISKIKTVNEIILKNEFPKQCACKFEFVFSFPRYNISFQNRPKML